VSVVGKVFKSIAADIRSRYTLAYEPAQTGNDSRLRRVQVTVNVPGRRGLKVRTRTGYIAGEPSPTSERNENGK
jgi:hypothetical protein